jgi:hypothetical protein
LVPARTGGNGRSIESSNGSPARRHRATSVIHACPSRPSNAATDAAVSAVSRLSNANRSSGST